MSKADVRVLNDLTESKKRVMTNVVQHLEQREMKKRSWRWQYSVMSIIVTVCIGIFIYTQYSGNQEQTASVPTLFDEKFLYFFLGMDPNVKDQKLTADGKVRFETYLHWESLYAYAQSKEVVPTQENIDNELEVMLESSIKAEQLKKVNLSKEEYFEQFTKPMTYKLVTIDTLLEQEKNRYKDVERMMLLFLVERDALNYFEEHYSQDIAYLREKYDIPVKEKGSRSKNGIVVAIKEHEFLVVSNVDESNIGELSVDEIVKKYGNGMWFPLIDTPKTLSLGDYVEVKYNEDRTQHDINIVRFADIESMKILEKHK